MYTLYVQLNMRDNCIKHWFNGFGWEMANCMSKQILKQIQTIVVKASFLFLNADEVITIDNQSWISMHAYVMHAWKKKFIILTLQHIVDGGNVDNLTAVIVQAFMLQGGLTQEETTKRLICFGANRASIFQGCHSSMTFQLKEKFAPCMMGDNCMAHRTNLPMVAKLEDLLQSLYSYFSNSPKHHLEFHFKLVKIIETRRFKIL
jgi:hypothetical protein